jgi:folate-binding protein YgfZ
MSQTYQIPDAAVSETPLGARLLAQNPALEMKMHRGAQTPLQYAAKTTELQSLLHAAGVFDLGYRAVLRVTGKDRVRWLNGMITQTVKGMNPGDIGYTLVLNPQGRMQGDADLSIHEEFLQLETDRSQSERLLSHLRRYIIMDDVKLEELAGSRTALGIAGPRAAQILQTLGSPAPEPGKFQAGNLAGVEITVYGSFGPALPRFEIHLATDDVLAVWNGLTGAGATPCGIECMEDLRVLEGVPACGVDFSDKHLPQETNLYRALNFTKGCYIGQEIVERIRARATVHRSLRQFELEGATPNPGPGQPIELRAGDTAVGELTSVAHFELPDLNKTLALGIVRVEALENVGAEPLRYEGGMAVALEAPPAVARA